MRETSVVLGVDDPGLQQELLHFLDRLPGVRVVGAAEGPDPLRALVRDRRPDSVVGVPDLLVDLDEAPTLAVSVRETTDGLRAAIRAGARGFYLWPAEREALGRDVTGTHLKDRAEPPEKGMIVAVLGARGGAGTTFLATNLAAALAKAGADTILADLDPISADVTPALGIAGDASLPSVSDLAEVAGELTNEHLERVLHEHPAGFRVLLAPHQVPPDARLDADTVVGVVRGLRVRFTSTVLHLPRILDRSVLSALELADEVLIVVTLDVLGIRSAKRMIDYLRSLGLGDGLRLVVNRAGRGEVVPQDAEAVLGVPVGCVISATRLVERAQNRGELVVGRRGGLSRRIDRLAARLLRGAAA